MTSNYLGKEKKTTLSSLGNFSKNKVIQKKKRINWNQSLKAKTTDNLKRNKKGIKLKKSLQYLLVLKKFNNVIDYKNIKLLKAFLTKYGKIRPRRKTKINIQYQRKIAKSIRKARAYGLIPFTCDVKA